ncbi:hypothetical protein [Ralstonia pseudosolanacearum]|uniref:hypothetical protein n=1 Tax=Ralstonia pseudosolanacearum TaxID=1310165 RepID=UPI003221B298
MRFDQFLSNPGQRSSIVRVLFDNEPLSKGQLYFRKWSRSGENISKAISAHLGCKARAHSRDTVGVDASRIFSEFEEWPHGRI